MKHVKVLSALGLMAMAGVANAGVTSTWTLTNDYDFRGITQTAKDPALQASLDYAHDSGFYAGVWFSNVKFCEGKSSLYSCGYKGDLEHDIYLGFTNKIGEDLTYDVGVIDYTYNQHVYDYQEIYASLAYKWIKGKIYYAPDFGGDTTHGNTNGWAVTADATIPLPANFSVLGHVGYNAGDYWANYFGTDLKYVDYSAGVGYTAGKFNLALKYVDTNTSESDGSRVTKSNSGSNVFNNDGRVVFTVATTFPW
jgi:uncharacterized protein (TIGR02001 family)